MEKRRPSDDDGSLNDLDYYDVIPCPRHNSRAEQKDICGVSCTPRVVIVVVVCIIVPFITLLLVAGFILLPTDVMIIVFVTAVLIFILLALCYAFICNCFM